MKKRELEIRLQVAENVIKESSYYLSDENIKEIQDKEKESYGYARSYAFGQINATLNFYKERANGAVFRNGEDIHIKKFNQEDK
ncbi:MAG: hypothetical protein K0R00_3199 [Herbinix sp.]|jgi:hypothetical protein|nr:hypothetical protein [Herbinix sp.]